MVELKGDLLAEDQVEAETVGIILRQEPWRKVDTPTHSGDRASPAARSPRGSHIAPHVHRCRKAATWAANVLAEAHCNDVDISTQQDMDLEHTFMAECHNVMSSACHPQQQALQLNVDPEEEAAETDPETKDRLLGHSTKGDDRNLTWNFLAPKQMHQKCTQDVSSAKLPDLEHTLARLLPRHNWHGVPTELHSV